MFNGRTYTFKGAPVAPSDYLSAVNSATDQSGLFSVPVVRANDWNYYGLTVTSSGEICLQNKDSTWYVIYSGGTWTEGYRTIEFIGEPDKFRIGLNDSDFGQILLWLNANADLNVHGNYVVSQKDMVYLADSIRARSSRTSEIEFPSGFMSEIAEI